MPTNKLTKISRFIKISNKSYGKSLQGTKIYYKGKKPKLLKADGSFQFGKNIIESISVKFKKFHIILISGKSKIEKSGQTYRFFISTVDLQKMSSILFGRSRDIKQRIIANIFAEIYPKQFKDNIPLFSYDKGLFKTILTKDFLPTILSTDDRQAINNFIPRFIASGVAGKRSGTTSKLTAGIELKVLKEIASDLEKRIKSDKSESTWQDYLKTNILHIQQGYIAFVEKANIGVVGTKFPDFLLVTHDEYLDILEIKTPVSSLLTEDKSRGNYFWTPELSKAISQTENYIHQVYSLGDKIRSEIKDKYGIELRVVRPRGVILAGNTEQFLKNKKMSDDFRLLSQGLKNITIVTYDELLVRLQNYISVLTELGK
jgi:hypothetical protein